MLLIIPEKESLIRRFDNGDHNNLVTDLVLHSKADMIQIPLLSEPWNLFEAKVHHEDLLFMISRESPQTKEIDESDTGRNKTLREIIHELKYQLTQSDDADVRSAASTLLLVTRPYATAYERPIFEKTGYIRNMLTDLKVTANAVLVNKVPGIAALVLKLETLNNRFDTLYIERNLALDEIAKLGKRRNVRKYVDRAMFDLIDAINGVYIVNELGVKDPGVKQKLVKFESLIRTMIAKIKESMARRHQHKKANPDDPNKKPSTPKPPAQKPDNTLPDAPTTPPQPPVATPPTINPDDLNPPAVGERIIEVKIDEKKNEK